MALMKKLRLSDSVRCECSWDRIESRLQSCKQRAGILKEKAGMTVAKVIEFYVPSKFRKSVKWVSPEQSGKIIEFASQINSRAGLVERKPA
jgi:hypothetical protein